jgi:hypothetical protein
MRIIWMTCMLALAGLCLGLAAAEPTVAYATPEMYGAKGDDGKDDTEALKKLFSEKHGKTIFIPAKEYLISDTVVLPKRSGMRVQGVSSGVQYLGQKKGLMGNMSRLVWIGGKDKPMVEYRGSGLIWDGVALHGKRSHETKERASIGFLVHKVSRGIGTGKALFNQISIFHCDTGFQVGTREGEGNCDLLIFNFFNVGACDVGYRVKNNMGMDHSFVFARSYGCKTFFYFERGGSIYVHSAGVHHPDNKELLRIGWAGKNNAKYTFGNLKFDAQLTEFRFVTMEQPIPAFITLTNLKRSFHYEKDKETGKHRVHSKYDRTGTFVLQGNAKLLIKNCSGVITKHCILATSGLPENNKAEDPATPLVLIENSEVSGDPNELLHPDSDKSTRLRVLNCFGYSGNWVEDKR